MRYDEAYSLMFFVNGTWERLFYYPLPNNHVLYTLVEKSAVLLLGQDPFVLRVPALLFGLTSIVVVFSVCRKLIGEQAGYLEARLHRRREGSQASGSTAADPLQCHLVPTLPPDGKRCLAPCRGARPPGSTVRRGHDRQ